MVLTISFLLDNAPLTSLYGRVLLGRDSSRLLVFLPVSLPPQHTIVFFTTSLVHHGMVHIHTHCEVCE